LIDSLDFYQWALATVFNKFPPDLPPSLPKPLLSFNYVTIGLNELNCNLVRHSVLKLFFLLFLVKHNLSSRRL